MYTIKRKIVILSLLFSLLTPFTYADTSEEDLCFSLLHDSIKNDTRFTKLQKSWLTNILAQSNKNIDLSKYDIFLQHRSKNPLWSSLSSEDRNILWTDSSGNPLRTEYDFLARRTNIATVVTWDTFVVSNLVWFGQTSNFRFPLPISQKEKDKWEKELGDHWKVLDNDNAFKEYVLYAHHNIKWEFLSCGIFHATPLWDYNYTSLQAANYFGNVIQWKDSQKNLGNKKCMSGFRWTKISNSDFYQMETDVCVMDYEENDFVRMEIIAIAYNNKSTYFNEYEIFPIQVASMVSDITSWQTLQDVRDTFLQRLKNETCLSIVHPKKETLPSKCNGEYTTLSYTIPENIKKKKSFFKSFLALIIPTSHAARDFRPPEEIIQNSQWLVVFTNFPLELYEKLQSLPNETFREYALFALNPWYETYMVRKQSEWQYLSAFEKTFLNCNISLKERTDVFIDLLEKIDINNFDITNLSYSNPKVGDCIIPYPDVTHRDTEIEGSFDSNIRLAKILNGTWETPAASERVIALIQEENTLQVEFERQKAELLQQFEEWVITSDELYESVAQAEKEYEEKIQKNKDNYFSVANQENMDIVSTPTDTYIIIAIIILLGCWFLWFALYTKKK